MMQAGDFSPAFSLIFSLIRVVFYFGLLRTIANSCLFVVENKGIFRLFLPIYVI